MFSKILVAYDGSDLAKKALNTAIQLSKLNPSSTVDIIHVYQYTYFVVGDGVFTPSVAESMDCIKRAEAVADEARALLSSASCEGNVVIREGLTARSIIEYGEELGCDLIVVGSRGLSGFSELVLGSVSHNIAQHSKVPVWIV
ncbi:MAG TPA: universal stress protein, partial [Bacillota bacterium]|nr:universal stress protein [Bacillota bacterium]